MSSPAPAPAPSATTSSTPIPLPSAPSLADYHPRNAFPIPRSAIISPSRSPLHRLFHSVSPYFNKFFRLAIPILSFFLLFFTIFSLTFWIARESTTNTEINSTGGVSEVRPIFFHCFPTWARNFYFAALGLSIPILVLAFFNSLAPSCCRCIRDGVQAFLPSEEPLWSENDRFRADHVNDGSGAAVIQFHPSVAAARLLKAVKQLFYFYWIGQAIQILVGVCFMLGILGFYLEFGSKVDYYSYSATYSFFCPLENQLFGLENSPATQTIEFLTLTAAAISILFVSLLLIIFGIRNSFNSCQKRWNLMERNRIFRENFGFSEAVENENIRIEMRDNNEMINNNINNNNNSHHHISVSIPAVRPPMIRPHSSLVRSAENSSGPKIFDFPRIYLFCYKFPCRECDSVATKYGIQRPTQQLTPPSQPLLQPQPQTQTPPATVTHKRSFSVVERSPLGARKLGLPTLPTRSTSIIRRNTWDGTPLSPIPEEPPTSPVSIASSSTSSSSSSSNSDFICIFCLDRFRPHEILLALPACGHQFHSICLKRWIIRGNQLCPLDRSTIK